MQRIGSTGWWVVPAWFAAVLALAFAGYGLAAQTRGDGESLEDEAASLLARYIRIDTTNPPGNETKAAEF
ncbi:MAG TPA: hypothetical protein VFU31_31480, partial [Candidatus Binatia bacterium]|nr:hypothetical protein [Candidatus Binatia bacterium]